MYYRHFRLSGPPFEAAAVPEALYLSRAHRESLAALEWGLLHEPSGFTTLTGETGTGKTTLICSILGRNFSQLSAAYVINPKLPFEDILRVILGQFGVPCPATTKLDRIEALVGFLGRRGLHERLAIIVDEAQDLSDDVLEELRLLSNYGQRLGRYLQLVLVGQPELAVRLKRPSLRQFNQRVAARSVLGRLSFAEAHEYVGYRLRAKGGRSRDIFEPDALAYLLRHSNGIPRRINVLCHNAMLVAFSSGCTRVDLKTARAAVSEHNESLLGGAAAAAALTVAHHWMKPAPFSVAAIAVLLALVYGFRAGSKPTPDAKTASLSAESTVSTVARDVPTATRVRTDEPPVSAVRSKGARLPRAERSLVATQIFSPAAQMPTHVAQTALPAAASPSRSPAGPRVIVEQGNQDEPAPGVSHLLADTGAQRPAVIVKYGDTLEKLAIRHLGSRDGLNVLIDANPQIADINRIYPGQKVYLSAKTEDQTQMERESVNGAERSSPEESADIWHSVNSLGPAAAEVVP